MSVGRKRDGMIDAESPGPFAKIVDRAILVFLFLLVGFAPLSIAATQTAWLLGLTCWLLRFAFYPRPVVQKTSLDYALLGFFILTGLSAFLSYEPMVSIGKLRAASLFTIVYLLGQNIHSKRVLRLLILTLIASCLLSAAFTFGQRSIGRGLKIQGLETESPLYTHGVRAGDTLLAVDGQTINGPDDLISALTSSNKGPAQIKTYRQEIIPTFKVPRGQFLAGNTAQQQLGIDSWSRGRDWRATGFYGHYVTYAEVLQLILALTVALYVFLPFKRSWWGALLLLAIAAMIGSLLLTITRASWVAFIISSAVIFLLGASRRSLLVVGVLAIPLILAGLFMLQAKRNVGFLDRTDGSITWRQSVWRGGFHLLVSEPRHLLVGVGMDSIKSHWREWGLFEQGRLPLGHMHSDLLEIALERGVPAMLVWLTLLGLYARVLWRLHRSLSMPDSAAVAKSSDRLLGPWIDRAIVLGALGGLVGFFVSGLVEYNWGDSEVVMIVYLIMGLTLALQRHYAVRGA